MTVPNLRRLLKELIRRYGFTCRSIQAVEPSPATSDDLGAAGALFIDLAELMHRWDKATTTKEVTAVQRQIANRITTYAGQDRLGIAETVRERMEGHTNERIAFEP